MRSDRARETLFSGLVALVVVVVASGCASGRPVVEPLGPERFHLKCTTELPGCLNEAADEACQGHHYIVERAVNEVNWRGSTPNQMAFRTSEAIIQCGGANGWGPLGPPMGPPETPPKEKAAPARVCAPGSTQTCVGAGSCKGGQACGLDGAAYGPCDCGPAPAAPVSDPTRPPS